MYLVHALGFRGGKKKNPNVSVIQHKQETVCCGKPQQMKFYLCRSTHGGLPGLN
jgi:hypothetical protein